jgi:hypothetical protein
MSSVISASRLWEGRISLSELGYDDKEYVKGFVVGVEGLTSARIAEGEIGSSMLAVPE